MTPDATLQLIYSTYLPTSHIKINFGVLGFWGNEYAANNSQQNGAYFARRIPYDDVGVDLGSDFRYGRFARKVA